MDFSGITLERAAGDALYRQLSDALVGAIARGELGDGARLPSERRLAERLAVSRTTVVDAYRELAARGLVRGQVGRGTFVCAVPEGPPDGAPFAWRGKVARGAQRTLDPALRALVGTAADPGPVPLAAGVPAIDLFPTDAFRAATDRALATGAAVGLSPTEGHPRLRRAIARRTGNRPREILVVAGAQQGLDLVARCLLDPGDAVIMDRPGYLGAIHAFRAAGAHPIGWDVVRSDLDELEDLIVRYRPKLLYLNPTFQNPTGRTLPRPTRQAVLDLAVRRRLPVVEDDPYREIGFGPAPPPPTLRAMDDRGVVIHVGTFAKTLAGGLRLGWLAAAESIVDQLALVKSRGDVACPTLTQLVVADLIEGGHLDAHLGTLRREHARRHATMLAALRRHFPPGSLTCRPAEGGLYLWCRLRGIDAADLLAAATAAGVAFAPGTPFYPDGAGRRELRLCFSAVPPAAIETGVRRLARVVLETSSQTRRAAASRSEP